MLIDAKNVNVVISCPIIFIILARVLAPSASEELTFWKPVLSKLFFTKVVAGTGSKKLQVAVRPPLTRGCVLHIQSR